MSEILPLIYATALDIRTAREHLDVARLQLEQTATEAGRISSLNAVNSASNGLREATNRLQAILNQSISLITELSALTTIPGSPDSLDGETADDEANPEGEA